MNGRDPSGNETLRDLEQQHDEYSDTIDRAIAEGADPDDLTDLIERRDYFASKIDSYKQDFLLEMQANVLEAMTGVARLAIKEFISSLKSEVVPPGVRANQINGARREVETVSALNEKYPDGSVQSQVYLRDSEGKILRDAETGMGRRLDHVVFQNGKAVDIVETTSPTANKTQQIARETRIHTTGAVFARDRATGELVNVTGQISRIERRP